MFNSELVESVSSPESFSQTSSIILKNEFKSESWANSMTVHAEVSHFKALENKTFCLGGGWIFNIYRPSGHELQGSIEASVLNSVKQEVMSSGAGRQLELRLQRFSGLLPEEAPWGGSLRRLQANILLPRRIPFCRRSNPSLPAPSACSGPRNCSSRCSLQIFLF